MTIRGCLGGAATAVIGAFMVLVIVSMISMVCTGKAHGGPVATSLIVGAPEIRAGVRSGSLRSRSSIQGGAFGCPTALVCSQPQRASEANDTLSAHASSQEARSRQALPQQPLGSAYLATVRTDSGTVLRTTQETARCLFYLQAARNAKEAWQTCAVSRGPRSQEQARARTALCTLQYGAGTISLCAPAQRRTTVLAAPDFAYLKAFALSSGLDWRIVVAVAWEETRSNVHPWVRGAVCWNETIRDPECDAGRFQIRVSTARARCPSKNIFTYEGNLACFAKMFFEDSQMGNTLVGGTLWAIRHHNGSGPLADQYVKRVLQTIGWLTVTEGT